MCFCVLLRCSPVQFLPSVTELVVAQCYYLDFDEKNRNKPIYVYLNSTGCINDKVRSRQWAGWKRLSALVVNRQCSETPRMAPRH